MAIGVSFLPGMNGQNQPNQNGNGEAAAPVQQAIKTLSLRLPRILGQGSVAPAALLNSQGAAGMGGSGMDIDRLIQSILSQLPMAGGAAQQGAPAQMGAPVMGAPAPAQFRPPGGMEPGGMGGRVPMPRVTVGDPEPPPVVPQPPIEPQQPLVEPWGGGPDRPIDRPVMGRLGRWGR